MVLFRTRNGSIPRFIYGTPKWFYIEPFFCFVFLVKGSIDQVWNPRVLFLVKGSIDQVWNPRVLYRTQRNPFLIVYRTF